MKPCKDLPGWYVKTLGTIGNFLPFLGRLPAPARDFGGAPGEESELSTTIDNPAPLRAE